LVVFEAIAGDPGCALGKLNTIEDNKHIAPIGLVEEAGKGSKIWPVGGNNHFSAKCRPGFVLAGLAEVVYYSAPPPAKKKSSLIKNKLRFCGVGKNANIES